MRANRGKDTRPELVLRRRLWAAGLRYRCHPRDVPGWPDICLKKAKLAIFVDGCFWHGCPRHWRLPKTRPDYWKEKVERNCETRRIALSRLGADWKVFAFFECQLKDHLDEALLEIMAGSELRGTSP